MAEVHMQEKFPLVSIIIPVCNVGSYISRCVDSCLAQEYRDLEIIAVNDGSKDNSGKLLDEFAEVDSRVRVYHKENGGVTSARETAISAASGDYLFFLDGDDYIPKDAIKLLVTRAQETDADIIAGDYTYVDESGAVTEKRTFSFDSMSPEDYYPLIFRHHQIYLCFKLIRRSLYRDIEVPPEITLGEDAICFVQLVQNAALIAKCDEVVYYYFRRSDSVTMSLRPKDLMMAYKASEWIVSYMMKFSVSTELALELKKYRLIQVILYLQRTKLTGFYREDIRLVLKHCFEGTDRRSLHLNYLDYFSLQMASLNPRFGGALMNSSAHLKRSICKLLGRV